MTRLAVSFVITFVIALLLAGELSFAEPVGPDVRRLEAVGTAPVRPGQRGAVATRDAAIQAALMEAVSRVARSFLHDAESPLAGDESAEGGGEDPSLEDVLGERMVPYTSRFRILEDKGERTALFDDEPGVTTEYVVIVEVFVDADRVEARLIEAGLLASQQALGESTRIRVEARGLGRHEGYVAFREALVGVGGARSAVPVLFERGRVVLAVELAAGDEGPNDLLERLLAEDLPGLEIRALESVEPAGHQSVGPPGSFGDAGWGQRSLDGQDDGPDEALLALEVRWTPPPAAPE